MNSTELLKSISSILKKHSDFLNDNPEIFYTIEDRLYKAVDDEYDDEGYEEDENYGEDEFSSMFDERPDDEDQDEEVEYEDIDSDYYDEEPEPEQAEAPSAPKEEPKIEKVPEKSKTSKGGYRDWAPKDEYHPKHQEAMDKLMEEGWSHREAERIVGAHDVGGDPRHSKIKASEPSEKMLSEAQGQAFDWLKGYERNLAANADARKNPVLAAKSINRKAHDETHDNFEDAYHEFLNSDEVKGLKHRAKHKAIQEFENKWHEENPDYEENTIGTAKTAGSFSEAKNTRKEHLDEGEKAIAEAGMARGDDASIMGEFSEAAAGGGDTTAQGKMQAVGGVQGESGGYTAGVVKDPSLHIAEQYPEYAEHLKQKQKAKLEETLNSPQFKQQKERYSAQKGFKKKGDE